MYFDDNCVRSTTVTISLTQFQPALMFFFYLGARDIILYIHNCIIHWKCTSFQKCWFTNDKRSVYLIILENKSCHEKKSQLFNSVDVFVRRCSRYAAQWRCRTTRFSSVFDAALCSRRTRVAGVRRARREGKRSFGGPQRRRWLRRGSKGQRRASYSVTARQGTGG